MKKFLACTLALILCLFCLAACGEKPATPPTQDTSAPTEAPTTEPTTEPTEPTVPVSIDEALLGKWELTMPYADFLAGAGVDSLFGGFTTDAVFHGYTVEFTKDGKLIHALSSKEMSACSAAFAKDYVDYLGDGGLYELYESLGMSQEDIEAMLAEENLTVDDVIAEISESVTSIFSEEDFIVTIVAATLGNDAEKDSSGNYIRTERYSATDGRIYSAPESEPLTENDAAEFVLSGDGNTLTITDSGTVMVFYRAA